jgi:hypothetical protein
MTAEFTLPSGARVQMRGMKVGHMIGRKDRDSDTLNLLKECTVAVLPPLPDEEHPAPINPYPNGLTDWKSATDFDILVGVIGMRYATYPDQPYILSMKCPSCRRTIPGENTTVNVRQVLDDFVIPMPDESIRAFVNGNRLPARIGQHNIEIRFTTGEVGMLDPEETPIEALATRILSFDGATEQKDIVAALIDMDLGTMDELLRFLEEAGGGVHDTMDVVCPNEVPVVGSTTGQTRPCGWAGEAKVPFLVSAFLFPYERGRVSRMMGRTRAARRKR